MKTEEVREIRISMAKVFRDIEKHASNATLDRLRSIGNAFDQYAWKAGWATEELYQEVIANGGTRTVEECCWYVAVTSFNGMRSMNTVKRYLYNARFYSPRTVAMYDVLPFSTFEYARSHPDGWKTVLDRALEEFRKNGRPQSVSGLRELIDNKPVGSEHTIRHDPSSNMDGEVRVFDASVGLLGTADVRQVTQAFVETLHSLAGLLPRVATLFPNLGIASARMITILKKIETAMTDGVDLEIPVP